MNPYIGHDSQLYGIEEYRLVGGKGDGMRLFETGDRIEPLEILYHMNMGYPFLDEDSVLTIPSIEVQPRDSHAAEDIAGWMLLS